MQDKVFFLKFGAEICEVILHHVQNAKPDHSETDRARPNQGLHHQIAM
jgi:hypothetical protein